jgi:hypothetical protein
MSTLLDLQAQLDRAAAPAVSMPVAALPMGVAVGLGGLSLDKQGAAIPGTPVLSFHLLSPKVSFPVFVSSVNNSCLVIIGQGLSLCFDHHAPLLPIKRMPNNFPSLRVQ